MGPNSFELYNTELG